MAITRETRRTRRMKAIRLRLPDGNSRDLTSMRVIYRTMDCCSSIRATNSGFGRDIDALCHIRPAPHEVEGQLCLDFGGPNLEPKHLLTIWDVDSKYQLLGLQLIKPQYMGEGPVLAKWSIRIPAVRRNLQGRLVLLGYCGGDGPGAHGR